jgi:hypothetical protein
MYLFLRAHVGAFCSTSIFASEHATVYRTLATQVGLYLVITSLRQLLITEKILSIISLDISADGYCRGLNDAGQGGCNWLYPATVSVSSLNQLPLCHTRSVLCPGISLHFVKSQDFVSG